MKKLLLSLLVAIGVIGSASAQTGIEIFTLVHAQGEFNRITLGGEMTDSIFNLKEKIQDKAGYSPNDQYLSAMGIVLNEDNRTLASYINQTRRDSVDINLALIDSFDSLTFSGNLPTSDGLYYFLMRSGTSGAGDGWSVFNYSNAVDLSATEVGRYNLDLYTVGPVDAGNVSGRVGEEMSDFNGQQSYDWTFITSTEGISGFSPDQFVINTVGFVNPFTGSFSVVQQGNSLAIEYTPASVPEPSTYALFGIGAIGMLVVMSRKKTA
jgi:hypothetical protein